MVELSVCFFSLNSLSVFLFANLTNVLITLYINNSPHFTTHTHTQRNTSSFSQFFCCCCCCCFLFDFERSIRAIRSVQSLPFYVYMLFACERERKKKKKLIYRFLFLFFFTCLTVLLFFLLFVSLTKEIARLNQQKKIEISLR